MFHGRVRNLPLLHVYLPLLVEVSSMPVSSFSLMVALLFVLGEGVRNRSRPFCLRENRGHPQLLLEDVDLADGTSRVSTPVSRRARGDLCLLSPEKNLSPKTFDGLLSRRSARLMSCASGSTQFTPRCLSRVGSSVNSPASGHASAVSSSSPQGMISRINDLDGLLAQSVEMEMTWESGSPSLLEEDESFSPTQSENPLPTFSSLEQTVQMGQPMRVPDPSAVATGQEFISVPPEGPARKYRLLEEIGRGTCGEVWKAEEEFTGALVALKLMFSEKAAIDAMLAHLKADAGPNLWEGGREIRALARIGSSGSSFLNLAHEVLIFDDGIVLVLELVEGKPLSNYFFPPAAIPLLSEQILNAGRELEELGLVHRDLKLSNIMLDERHSRVVVVDFGSTTSIMGDGPISVVAAGSPAFMSPLILLQLIELGAQPFQVSRDDLIAADIHAALMVIHAVATSSVYVFALPLSVLLETPELRANPQLKPFRAAFTRWLALSGPPSYSSLLADPFFGKERIATDLRFILETPTTDRRFIEEGRAAVTLEEGGRKQALMAGYERAKGALGLARSGLSRFSDVGQVVFMDRSTPNPNMKMSHLIVGTGPEARVYRREERIAKGSFGEVWRGWELRSGLPVALKFRMDQPERGADPQAEVKALAAIGRSSSKHLNFCHEVIRFQDGELFVLEFVDGRPIDKFQYGPPQAQALGSQLFKALSELHELNIAHRDLKPNNVLLDTEGKVVIVDFGEALLLQGEGPFPKPGIRGHDGYRSCEFEMLCRAESPALLISKDCFFRSDVHALLVSLATVASGVSYMCIPRTSLLAQIPEFCGPLNVQWEPLRAALERVSGGERALLQASPVDVLNDEFFAPSQLDGRSLLLVGLPAAYPSGKSFSVGCNPESGSAELTDLANRFQVVAVTCTRAIEEWKRVGLPLPERS